MKFCDDVVSAVFSQKAVFTVIVTLAVHKILFPKQDIRNHQSSMKNGFSARTVDTQFITPTLKQLSLPSMSESGWLTRSLEQPYPYDFNYNGKIGNKKVRTAFLNLVDLIERKEEFSGEIICYILSAVNKEIEKNRIVIHKLNNPEILSIDQIINLLNWHFETKYKTQGGSKLPVLAFYAIFKIIIKEVARYKACILGNLGSHTASDRTSKTAADIQIFANNNFDDLLEAIEIKHNKIIDANMLRVAREKIIKYNPKRYYIISNRRVKKSEIIEIKKIVEEIQNEHGCQVIINGILDTIRYYLRLINSLGKFLENYTELVENDSELKLIHKSRLSDLLKELS